MQSRIRKSCWNTWKAVAFGATNTPKKINSIKCKALEFDLILPVESGPKQGFHPPRLPPTANEDREDNGNRNQI